MPALSHLGSLQMTKEGTWGTNPGVNYTAQAIQSESLQHKPAFIFSKPIVGARSAPTQKVSGRERAQGQISFEADPEGILGMLIKGILSAETTVDHGSGNGGTHTFVPEDAVPPSFSILVDRDTTVDNSNVWEYLGAKVGKLTLEAQEGQLLKVSADITAKLGQEAASPSTPTYTTEQPLVYHSGTFTIDASAAAVKSFKVDIDAGLFADRGQLGSKYIQEQQPGLINVTGELEAYFDSMVLVDAFLQGTDAAIVLNLTGTAVGNQTRGLTITIPVAQFIGEPPVLAANGQEIMLKLPFQAWLSGAGTPNALVQLALLNSQRTAY